MEIALAGLADAANISREGKLNLLGIFDTIAARQFPVDHPSMVFAFQARFEYEDQNKEFQLEVRLIDQDGRILFGASAKVKTGPIAPGQFVHADQLLQLNGLRFARPGRHRFRVQVAGSEPHDTVFQVVHLA